MTQSKKHTIGMVIFVLIVGVLFQVGYHPISSARHHLRIASVRAELPQARAKWDGAGITDYIFEIQGNAIDVLSDAGVDWADLDIFSDAGINWSDMDVLSDTGVNWSDLDVLSDAGINWVDIDVLSDAGVNWSDLDVLTDAGINWLDIDALSDTGVNWSDLGSLSNAGVNWSDIYVLSDAGVNWAEIDVLSDAGVNWADLDVLTDAGINWLSIDVLSDVGINWEDIGTLSAAGINWLDIDVLSDAGINWKHIATAIAWFGSPPGGSLLFYPDGPWGPPVQYPVLHNSALLLDTDSIFHGVEPVGTGDDVPLPEPGPDQRLEWKDSEGWALLDHEQVIARYRWDQVRFSISWKAYCYEDEAEREQVRTHSDDIAREQAIEMLVEDLRRRRRIEARPSDTELALAIIHEYIRFPPPLEAPRGR